MLRTWGLAFVGIVAACGARTVIDRDADSGAGGAGGATASASLASMSSASVSVVQSSSSMSSTGPGGGLPGVSTIISEAPDSFFEAETDVEVNGNGRVAAAWIAAGVDGHSWIGVAFSNGGATWSAPAKIATPAGKDASDPVLTVDPAGNFHLVWIGFHRDAQGQPLDLSVYYARAGAAAAAFGPTVEISPMGDNDKPWVTFTPGGAVLVTWAVFGPAAYAIRTARSSDGQNFKVSDLVSDKTMQIGYQHARPCVAADSKRVWASYVRYTVQGQTQAFLSASDDDGVTWSANGGIKVSTANNVASTDAACAAAGGKVWVAYSLSDDMPSEQTNPVVKSLLVARSDDAGTTIATTFEVQDGSGLQKLLPQMVNAADGLHLDYYRGAQPGDPATMTEVRVEPTGGKLLATRQLADGLTFENQRASQAWLGDYTGLRVKGTTLYATFADNTDGTSHIRFVRTP